MSRFAVALTLALVSITVPAIVAAQAAPAGAPHGTPPYATACESGLRLLVSRDFDGALAAFRQAVQISGSDPRAFYYMGEAQRVRGNLNDALEMFRTAARLASASGDARMQARGLQGIAETLERIEGKRNEARTAWTEYMRFADQNTAVAFPDLARARIQALDAMRELDETYADVRERIATRVRENASAPARPSSGTSAQ
jgi:tetratricopeptide (TPR) repeat protein